MHNRYCEKKVKDALADTPVVVISGPRQSGKTTLAKQIQKDDYLYITLDDVTQFNAAKHDPVNFIRGLNGRRIILDEVQRVPDLFLVIKQIVDENRQAGRFLLTGSSNAFMLPGVADSLAGRIEVITLLPLTTCEITGTSSTFIRKIFSGKIPRTKEVRIRKSLITKILSGGFPEPLGRAQQERKAAWHQQYIKSIIQKDLKDIGKIEHIDVMPKLVKLLAEQVAQLTNYTGIANALNITHQTVSHYISLLEQLYIFERLPAWHRNENKRLIKTPKIHIVDSGLLCTLKRLTKDKIMENFSLYGPLLENYVVTEIKRLVTWHNEWIGFYYYRDKDQVEVDLVLENYDGALVGIEVKASSTVTSKDFQGLRRLKNLAGEKFIMGLILYDGDHSTQHEERLYSIPIGCLWE